MTAPTKAMVLAAGLGTRLRPLTNDRPKALVEINGRTLLEITLSKLRAAGVTDVIVNVHHFADMIVDYLKQKQNFGLRIEISREDDLLLDTGGGLKKASWFFLEKSPREPDQAMGTSFVGRGFSSGFGSPVDSTGVQKPDRDIEAPSVEGASAPDDPFVLHNVDVISNVDLCKMAEYHAAQNALATLMVQNRKTSRPLLFDDQGSLTGRRFSDGRPDEIARPAPARQAPPNLSRQAPSIKDPQALAFGGIHIISPRLLPMIAEDGVFSIITTYLRLAAQGEKIAAYRADDAFWRDLGNAESLQQAAQDLRQHPGL